MILFRTLQTRFWVVLATRVCSSCRTSPYGFAVKLAIETFFFSMSCWHHMLGLVEEQPSASKISRSAMSNHSTFLSWQAVTKSTSCSIQSSLHFDSTIRKAPRTMQSAVNVLLDFETIDVPNTCLARAIWMNCCIKPRYLQDARMSHEEDVPIYAKYGWSLPCGLPIRGLWLSKTYQYLHVVPSEWYGRVGSGHRFRKLTCS